MKDRRLLKYVLLIQTVLSMRELFIVLSLHNIAGSTFNLSASTDSFIKRAKGWIDIPKVS